MVQVKSISTACNLCCRYSPFLMACYNPDTEDFQSVCRVMSGFSDSFYTEVSDVVSNIIKFYTEVILGTLLAYCD